MHSIETNMGKHSRNTLIERKKKNIYSLTISKYVNHRITLTWNTNITLHKEKFLCISQRYIETKLCCGVTDPPVSEHVVCEISYFLFVYIGNCNEDNRTEQFSHTQISDDSSMTVDENIHGCTFHSDVPESETPFHFQDHDSMDLSNDDYKSSSS